MTPAGWVAPMLPTLVKSLPSGDDWVFERKHDGFRCLAVRRGDDVKLWSRSGKPLRNNHVVAALRLQRHLGDCVLDGELAAGQFGGAAVDHGYHVFDAISLDGADLRPKPLAERVAQLGAALEPLGMVRLVETSRRGSDLLEEAVAASWEGVVAKSLSSPYISGRSKAWRKLKCVQTEEFVIGGFTEPSGSRSGLGALMVGYYDDSGLRYAGKVGTGFTHEMLVRLRAALGELETEASPFAERVREKTAHWVAPGVVCRVEYLEWSSEGKLRHPSFQGLASSDPLSVRRDGDSTHK